jgi:hypothetical protein
MLLAEVRREWGWQEGFVVGRLCVDIVAGAGVVRMAEKVDDGASSGEELVRVAGGGVVRCRGGC